MRAHVRFSVGAAALALAACATAPVARPVTSTQSDPPTVHVNVAGLFPVASSRTVGDARTLHPGLLARVSVEPAASIGTGDVEPWLSRRLLAWLVAHGSEVLVTPPGTATAQKPTATLVGVRFRHIKDSARVVVAPSEGGGQRVRYWAGKGDTSLCGAPITIQLSYVQLEAVLTDAEGRWVASIAEVVAVDPPMAAVDVDGDVCAALPTLWNDTLAPGEAELDHAAALALDQGFAEILKVAGAG